VSFGLFWTSLGRLLGPFGHPLSALWSLMGTCRASLAPLGCLGACFMSLGSCWPFPSLYGIIRSRHSMNMKYPSDARLGPPLAFLGVLSAPIGHLWVPLVSFWVSVGRFLWSMGHVLDCCCPFPPHRPSVRICVLFGLFVVYVPMHRGSG